jgi:hypothetical protein
MSNSVAVQEKPILFSGPMVRAVMDGRKTQTRRVVKPLPSWQVHSICDPSAAADPWAVWFHYPETERVGHLRNCPYGKPGDRLWVRETWNRCVCAACDKALPNKGPHGCVYRASYNGPSGQVFKPSIHMPRWASRLTLEIVSVQVERVQDISEEDAIAEGCKAEVYTAEDVANLQISDAAPHIKELGRILGPGSVPARTDFMRLWDSINSKREDGKYAWEKNPWVWAIEFNKLAGAAEGKR